MNFAEKDEGGESRDGALPRDIGLLLSEIEREAVPEQLMALARKLQQALCESRQVSAETGDDLAAAINPRYRPQTRP